MRNLKGFVELGVFATFLMAAVTIGFGQDAPQGAYPPLQIGDSTAPNRVELFGDYRCEAAGVLFKNYRAMVDRHPGEVVVTFRHFPIGKNSIAAIRAVEAAGSQGKFVEMMQMIYDNAQAWKESDAAQAVFTGYSEVLGLDAKLFALDVDSAVTAERIARDRERAKALGVTGTPWVLWNDRPMSYGDAQELEKVIFPVKE